MKIIVVIVLVTVYFCQTRVEESRDSLVWPSPPDRPRIKYLETLVSKDHIQQDHGVLSHVLKFLFGGDQSPQPLIQPVGIAISREGLLYVADPGANGVHRIDREGKEHVLVVETKYGNFRSPVGVACGDNGEVYISDSDGGNVIIADKDLEGQILVRDHLIRPTGICIIHGKLYVVDTKKHAVVIFDLKGNYVSEFGVRGEGDGEFNYPVQIAGRDSVYIVDALNYRLQIFDSKGKFLRKFGQQGNALGRFASPKAVALDSEGDVYVTDALLDNLQIFSTAGRLLLSVGQRGSRDGEFMMPNGIAIDKQDRIYVVDTMNRRIQVFQYLK